MSNAAATPPMGAPAGPPTNLPMYTVNRHVGMFIGYGTLGAVALAIIFRLPLFYRHRLAPSRSPSQGYLLASKPRRSCQSQAKPANASSAATVSAHQLLRKTLGLPVPLTGGLVLGKLLLMILYMAVLVILSVYKNTDPVTNIKNYRRFGFIAIAQLPLTFVLAMKNGPIGVLTGEGYEKLNFLHRFTGRMVFVFSVVHGALQMHLQKTLANSIHFKGHSLTGLVALCALFVIAFSGIRFIRNSVYQIFLSLHIAGYITVIVALWKHTKHAHPYLAVSIGALAADNLLKFFKTRVKRATFTAMPGGLTRIEVGGVSDGWRAGQHVFIRVLKGRHVFEKHPFTIANAPSSSSPYGSTKHLLLVAKATGDFTRSIHSLAGRPRSLDRAPLEEKTKEKLETSNNDLESPSPAVASSDTSFHVLLDGPYGAFFNDMTRYPVVLLCAGGSGFTYCMAALEDIVGEAVQSGQSMVRHVCLVWSLREPDMIESFGPSLEETIKLGQSHDVEVTLKLFLTGRGAGDPSQNWLPNTLVEFNSTRPDLAQIIAQLIDGAPGGGLAIGVCGPTGLVDGMRDTVRELDPARVKKVGGVALHSEKFGW